MTHGCGPRGYAQQLEALGLEGELPQWCSAKDAIREMLRRHDVKGGVNRIIEYDSSFTVRHRLSPRRVEDALVGGLIPRVAEKTEPLPTSMRCENDVTMTHGMPPAVGRRQLLAISISAASAIGLSACGSSPPKPSSGQSGAPSEKEVPVTPPEDLMREHGVLKRVLLIYREGIHRLQAEEPDPSQALNASAGIVRSFIEDYHEHLEEQYVFPNLEQAGKLTDITTVLRAQHQRGRALTDRILGATAAAAALDQAARAALVQDMSAFIRMYEPHEAREDTVVFPALRDVLPAQKFRDLAEIFEDEEHKRFGPAGFEGVVDKVADIEKSLGIYDLSQFTPT